MNLFRLFRSVIPLFLCLAGCFTSECQEIYVKVGLSMGKHFKHSTKTIYETPGLSFGQEISVLYQTSGTKAWEEYFGRPRIGANFLHTSFGNNQILGTAVGFYPSIEYFLQRSQKINSAFFLGVGVAYINKYFDYNSNSLNNAIGSAWNNISRLGLTFNFSLSERSKLNANLNLTHFSNGGIQLPNLGVNIFGGGLGYTHLLNSFKKTEENVFINEVALKKKWGLDITGGMGISEYGIFGGPKLPTYYTSIAGYKVLSPFVRIYLGMEYEYSEPVFQFFYQDFNDRTTASKKASNYSSFITTELMHDRFAFRFQTGYYLPIPDIRIDKAPLYFKLHLLTYAGNEKWKFRPYGGILLKTHFSIAQYIGLVGGVRI